MILICVDKTNLDKEPTIVLRNLPNTDKTREIYTMYRNWSFRTNEEYLLVPDNFIE